MKRAVPFRTTRRDLGSLQAVTTLCLVILVGSWLQAPKPLQAQSRPRPRIVNGVIDADSPAVGSLLDLGGVRDFTDRLGACTGTLIGCSTFVVAAHCVCDEIAFTAAECATLGTIRPARLAVFLPHAGIFPVRSIEVAPDFDFEVAGDLAVLRLGTVVDGVTPVPLYRGPHLPFGSEASIVGYGTTSEDANDGGIKRVGAIVTGACPTQVNAANHICWTYDSLVGTPGTDSNTCYGDSGGPLFVRDGTSLQLAGITSGGTPTCDPGGASWNTDVTTELSFIEQVADGDLGAVACSDLPPVGDERVTVKTYTLALDTRSGNFATQIELPQGIRQLRVGLNGEEYGPAPLQRPNDFDLFVNYGAPALASGTNRCSDETVGTWAFCEIALPEPGVWHVNVVPAAGSGAAQLTITAITATATDCTGDCNGDGVSVDEIVRGINIALGEASLDTCSAFDADGSASVTVDEILQALAYALEGCPG